MSQEGGRGGCAGGITAGVRRDVLYLLRCVNVAEVEEKEQCIKKRCILRD